MRCRGILIDLDGTLIDSLPTLFKAYHQFLLSQDRKGTREEFLSMDGMPLLKTIPILKERHGMSSSEEDLRSNLALIVEKEYLDSPLMEGAFEFLSWARDEKIELGLVTSSRGEWVSEILRRRKIASFFKTVVSVDRVQNFKPSPEGFLLGLTELGLRKEEVWGVEDSKAGLLALDGAGIGKAKFSLKEEEWSEDPLVGDWEKLLTYFKGKKYGTYPSPS